jgi:hypothetical protein
MTKKTAKKIASRAKKLLKIKEQTNANYKRMDRLSEEIRELGLKPGQGVIVNSKGDRVVLRDVHDGKDKVFKTHVCSRYELELEKAAS